MPEDFKVQSNSSQHRLIIVAGERLLNVTPKDKIELTVYIRPLELGFTMVKNVCFTIVKI